MVRKQIDVAVRCRFFDNVGGEILDFSLTVMKRYGRIAACGAISSMCHLVESNAFIYLY